MFSYISFINETDYPAITVFSDEKQIFDNILKNMQSDFFKTECGSLDFCFKENRDKPFLRIWVSLFPDTKYTLVIKNNKSFFKENKRDCCL